MDGLFIHNGNPSFLMDDLGVPLFLETPNICLCFFVLEVSHQVIEVG